MKRQDLIRRIRRAAKAAGVPVREYELARHSGITVGTTSTTVPRHHEITDLLAEQIFKQLEPALGKGWWRR